MRPFLILTSQIENFTLSPPELMNISNKINRRLNQKLAAEEEARMSLQLRKRLIDLLNITD